MRKLFIVLAFIFAVIGIAFAILPMGTIGILPVGLSILFGILAFVKSAPGDKNVPKSLIVLAALTLVAIIGRSFVPDEVAADAQFEKKKVESKQEDLKDLEELEGLE